MYQGDDIETTLDSNNSTSEKKILPFGLYFTVAPYLISIITNIINHISNKREKIPMHDLVQSQKYYILGALI